MAKRAKCPACGNNTALDGKGKIKAHRGGMSRDYAAGMVCTGTGSTPT